MYKLLIFRDFFRLFFPWCMKRYIKKTRKLQQKTICKLKNKPRITVAFFLQTPSVWKYDELYRYLQQSQRFNPVVVICPYNVHLNYSKKECLNVMKQTETFVQNKGYNYISSYNEQKKHWINIKKILNPDIVFFTKPYKDTVPSCYIYRFRDKISCYTGYGYNLLNNHRRAYNLPFHNLLFHQFVETEFHEQLVRQYSDIKGENVVITRRLGADSLMDKNYIPKNAWNMQNVPKKKIIWAPHHTIDYMFKFSNFMQYCDKMVSLAKKYEQYIQFAFKPHPVLKFKLINLWGEKKTEDYYNLWKTMPNTQIEEGYYIDLFLTSDALIHDGASFTAEYLHTCKPTLFLVRDENITKEWNEFGDMAFNLHYHARNEQEIENFIEKTILLGDDPMSEARKKFYNQYLYPKDGIMPSEKIYKILEEETR
jgi:hypothetical protein